jgi:hypothetical protein
MIEPPLTRPLLAPLPRPAPLLPLPPPFCRCSWRPAGFCMNAALFSKFSVQRSFPSLKVSGGSLATALLALSRSMLSMKSVTSLKKGLSLEFWTKPKLHSRILYPGSEDDNEKKKG